MNILGYLHEKGRYRVSLSGTAPTKLMAIKRENLRYSATSTDSAVALFCPVIVCDLAAAPELNALRGEVTGFDAERGRYVVEIEGRKKPAALKPQNCALGIITDEWDQPIEAWHVDFHKPYPPAASS